MSKGNTLIIEKSSLDILGDFAIIKQWQTKNTIKKIKKHVLKRLLSGIVITKKSARLLWTNITLSLKSLNVNESGTKRNTTDRLLKESDVLLVDLNQTLKTSLFITLMEIMEVVENPLIIKRITS